MNKNVKQHPAKNLFYENGLKFECTKCSNCCRKDPGYVFLNKKDIKHLSYGLNETIQFILEKYCRIVNISGFKRISFKEKENYDCIFWENTGCTIYKYRPYQCKSFPFWRHNLDSEAAWNSLQYECPGINKGRKHSKKEINRWMETREKQGFLTDNDIEKYFGSKV